MMNITVIPIAFVSFFILIQIISSNTLKCESQGSGINGTDCTFNSGRSKRAPFNSEANMLKIRMKYSTEEEVTLNWVMVDQYLANKHLPVIAPFSYPNLNVMENIGDFVMYQDLKLSSAVVHFKKTNTMFGVIGINYYVVGLPFDFNENGEYNRGTVGEPYVQKHHHSLNHIHPDNVLPPISDNDAWKDFFSHFNPDLDQQSPHEMQYDSGQNSKCIHNGQPFDDDMEGPVSEKRPRNSRQRRTIPVFQPYYLETLVFITRDIADLFKQFFGEDDYIEWIVKYYIVYFNAVDMVLGKSLNPHRMIFINIAQVVVEDELTPFNFINRDGELQFSEVVAKLPAYLDAYSDEYPPDSFDYVFIHTSRTIMDDIIPVRGLTKHGHDLYEARKKNKFYDAVPITIATYQYNFGNYEVADHEIGRIWIQSTFWQMTLVRKQLSCTTKTYLCTENIVGNRFNVEIDSREKGINSLGQCYGIMQTDGPKCENCLNWSQESVEQFRNFLRANRNRCFLLNSPRSLYSDRVRKYLTPCQQCRCFGYFGHEPYLSGCPKFEVGAYRCHKPLKCEKRDPESSVEMTVRPFDGTPCSHKKVCWSGKCVSRPSD